MLERLLTMFRFNIIKVASIHEMTSRFVLLSERGINENEYLRSARAVFDQFDYILHYKDI